MKEQKQLLLKDIPDDIIAEWRIRLKQEKPIAELEAKRLQMIRFRRYYEANELKEKIRKIEDDVLHALLNEYKGESVRMDTLMEGMDREDIAELNTLSTAIIMCCDMLETFVMDNNELLHKYHPDFNLEMYDGLIAMGNEAKKHMSFMANNTSMGYQYCIADTCDDITELVRNKARSMMRKYNKKKNEND